MVSAGTMPTARQITTSTSTGSRIRNGGSCGVFGRSGLSGPKKTLWMKRSE